MRSIVITDSSAHPAAAPFYTWCNLEPISFGGIVIDWLQIDKVLPKPKLTLFKILEDICYSNRGEGAVVVCHGNDHALLVQLHKNTNQKLTLSAAQTLVSFLDRQTAKSEKEIAKELGFATKELGDFQILCDLLVDVRALRLKHFALRACNMGKTGTLFLETVKRLLQCDMISGPYCKDAYIDWNPHNYSPNSEHFEKTIADVRLGQKLVWGQKPNRVAIQGGQTPAQQARSEWSMASLAENSTSAVQEFLEEFFPTTKPFTYCQGTIVPIHGFYYNGAIVFPGSAHYAGLLVTVPKFESIPLPMYFPPEEVVRPIQRITAKIRSGFQRRRAARG